MIAWANLSTAHVARHDPADSSTRRLVIKPTHLIGGYGQLSFAFNYHGPTGSQRDEITTIRRRGQEVRF
ncbi:hypothetical protein [Saccharopolyspora sp. ASAGF58]|uniref:hypothetical protein n=1 Tax=Saccharopolyspora sp. ASAGF58 TaxID=2719023 RepID=UPI0014401276|nr:hypothetical protein [Saccharopolyspora sp. ASAGF58]QIZ38658.1 hypothetical protein FDZ84_34265 [Saccharopolyspora sp. ASAGF58]